VPFWISQLAQVCRISYQRTDLTLAVPCRTERTRR
jgi:hypothetical protein